jgi:hypothetical protein
VAGTTCCLVPSVVSSHRVVVLRLLAQLLAGLRLHMCDQHMWGQQGDQFMVHILIKLRRASHWVCKNAEGLKGASISVPEALQHASSTLELLRYVGAPDARLQTTSMYGLQAQRC